jgi:hypothetical protein
MTKHILFLTTEEIKRMENGQRIRRYIEDNEEIVVVKADTSKEGRLIIEEENK